MNKIKDLKTIKNVLTNNYHGMKFSDDDMYQLGNRLFINQEGVITTYEYPMNEYYEALGTSFNLTTLPFKDYINFEVNAHFNKNKVTN